MTAVDIEYCVPCGHLERAQELQESILSGFGRDVESVSLVTGDSGVFEVRVDGDLVFDADEEGYDEGEIVDRIEERL